MRTHEETQVSTTAPKCIPNAQKCIPIAQKCIPIAQKCIPTAQKCIPSEPKCIPKKTQYACDECGKVLASHFSLQRHITKSCKGKVDHHACPHCSQVFTDVHNKYRHEKKCKEKHDCQNSQEVNVAEPTTTTIQSQVNNNIQTQVNNVDNSVDNRVTYNNQTNVILNFPESLDDDNFKLVKDHMTVKRLEHLFNRKFQPKQGFARYTHALMEKPENRNVYKTGPNTKYTRICKDGEWLYELDEEVFPLLTYHISVAAIDDINNHKKELKKGGKVDYFEVAKCLDDINTENDENDNYSFALEKLKVAVLNFSQRFGLPIGDV
jgi:hypothetical protein